MKFPDSWDSLLLIRWSRKIYICFYFSTESLHSHLKFWLLFKVLYFLKFLFRIWLLWNFNYDSKFYLDSTGKKKKLLHLILIHWKISITSIYGIFMKNVRILHDHRKISAKYLKLSSNIFLQISEIQISLPDLEEQTSNVFRMFGQGGFQTAFSRSCVIFVGGGVERGWGVMLPVTRLWKLRSFETLSTTRGTALQNRVHVLPNFRILLRRENVRLVYV